MKPTPPLAVRHAHGLCLLAVMTGVCATGLAIAHAYAGPGLGTRELLAYLAMRSVVFGLAVLLSERMRDGSDPARWTLAVLLGMTGLGSLFVGPAGWLVDGTTLATLDFSPLEWVFATSRVVHVLAVVGGLLWMFSPVANRWFAVRPAIIEAT